jgi:MtN3 and saliva related transmembrane protein
MIAGIIGLAAGAGTTFSFLPQVLAVFRRERQELSLAMFGIHGSGLACWIAYGVLKRDLILIGYNAVALVMVMTILGRVAWTLRAARVVSQDAIDPC